MSDHTFVPDEIEARVRTFLTNEVIVDEAVQLDGSTPLLSGLVDSIGLMELVSFLEDEFGITLENQDVDAVNFRTVSDIAQLVSRRMRER
jgi:methoxymalonate biosynthesis acyl carrier protein